MKIKFGAIVTEGSGKLGGHVASKNRGGAYIRTKTTPTNPQTVAQQKARALLGHLSSGWASLTADQRLTWENAVSSFATTDIFGDIKNPSGINLYVKLNTNLTNVGLAAILVAPIKTEVPFSLILSAVKDISSATFAVTFSDANLNGQKVLVFATPSLSQGIKFVKDRLRVIGFFTVTANAIDINSAYTSKYGVALPSANVVIKVVPVVPSGQVGVGQTFKALVQV